MIEVLRNKNLTTRFQILVEIANSGPNIQQRNIAEELDITPQAVSDYLSQLIRDGMLTSEGRSSYKVTNQGVNWIIKNLKELNDYNTYIRRAITSISICTALAETELEDGQQISLKMKNGLLYAAPGSNSGATGITISAAKAGEDVGITSIRGIVPLEQGRVTIARVPGVQRGGSRQADTGSLKSHVKRDDMVAALGLESVAALRRTGANFVHFGAVEASIEAAKSGLNTLVVCVENETSGLIKRLEAENIRYELIDAELV